MNLDELSAALRSPDPAVRDDWAYAELARLIPGLTEDQRVGLGDELAGRFTDPEIQSRAFAPLVLARLVEAGAYRPGWQDAFAHWYPAETDLRGHTGGPVPLRHAGTVRQAVADVLAITSPCAG